MGAVELGPRGFRRLRRCLGEPVEEMREGCRELVAPDETAVLAETSLDAIVMKDSQRDRCLADPSSADQSHGFEVFGEANNLPQSTRRGQSRPLVAVEVTLRVR
jgi:hypothetical protein